METLPIRFYNCQILRNNTFLKEDLWVWKGKIVAPLEKGTNCQNIDCKGALISPGLIDLQLMGGFGVDFSNPENNVGDIAKVRMQLLTQGVTSFCPTVTSAHPSVYEKVLPNLRKSPGGKETGAEIVGIHLEGPFINLKMRGAHNELVIRSFEKGYETVEEVYKDFHSIRIVTLAPELPKGLEVCKRLSEKGIRVWIGHTSATMQDAKEAFRNGASCITHLFNAMEPFHHRNPSLLGFITEDVGKQVYYGLIADGHHSHPLALRVAYRCNPKGVILVTDACSAMGLGNGIFTIGPQKVEIEGTKAVIQGTNILAASVSSLLDCVKFFQNAAGCTWAEALEAATLHPAKLLGIEGRKGSLEIGTDADFVLMSPNNLDILSTWIGGECVFSKIN